MLSWKKYTTNAHAHKGQSHSPYVWDFPQIVVLNRLSLRSNDWGQQVAWVAAYQSSIVCNRSWEISCSWPTKIRWLKSAHQVRSSTSVVSHDMRVRVSLSAPSKATNKKFVAFYFWKIWTSSSARTEKTHGSADDFNQSQLLWSSNRSWEISCSWPTKIRRQVGSSS